MDVKHKVFVLQIPNRRDRATGKMVPVFNIAPAAEYGDVEVIMPAEASFYAGDILMRGLRDSLKDYNPSTDYVVPTGDPSIIAGAAALLGRMFGQFTLLKWDRQVSRYLPIEVKVPY